MPLNASELELNPGTNPTDSLTALSQKLYVRNLAKERLKLAQEGRREQGGTFLKDYLNPQHYLTGSEYDPVITTKLQAALARGAQMAQQGADIPSMLMELGPMVGEINQYSAKAKVIDQQIKDNLSKIKQYSGYNQEATLSEAKKMAFHAIDPKTGEYGAQKDINNVDPSLNYVQMAIRERPERLTTGIGMEEFAKKTPIQKNLSDYTSYTKAGTMDRTKVHLIGQNYQVPELDEQGNPTGMVPKYDHANDGGQLIQHDFTDAKGKVTKAPVRLLDEHLFDSIMAERPDLADHYRGLVKQHLNEYNTGKDQPIGLESPAAKLVARAMAYDDLKSHSTSTVENADVVGKPSAAEINLHEYGGDYQRSFNKAAGRDDANLSRGILPRGRANPKTNTVDALHEIATNNPEFLHGDASEQQGQAVMNVTNMLPRAQLKYGAKAADSYKNVFYNPSTHSFLLQKRDNTFDPEVTQKDIPAMLYKVATANAVPNGTKYVDKSLGTYGYSDGKYASTGDAPDLTAPLTKAREAQITHGLDELEARGTVKTLKGLHTPEGEITGVTVRNAFQRIAMDKYKLSVKKPDGTIEQPTFPDRAALEKYLKQSTLKAPGNKADDLIDKYSK